MASQEFVELTPYLLFDEEAYLLSKEIMERYAPDVDVAMMVMFSLGVAKGKANERNSGPYDRKR
ncbi:hypothetical protein [Vagococcus fessus]|uniref:Uncharacterized protein n=1 Tax=Vagococcus fessus TaxID=120370 RepID=A0A430ABP2_9ENTE|nr:hypothetical protein [Vagococcus fessus]RSU04630.1 hypothetical protein CBF31_01020 [Vagococcus fessus]